MIADIIQPGEVLFAILTFLWDFKQWIIVMVICFYLGMLGVEKAKEKS